MGSIQSVMDWSRIENNNSNTTRASGSVANNNPNLTAVSSPGATLSYSVVNHFNAPAPKESVRVAPVEIRLELTRILQDSIQIQIAAGNVISGDVGRASVANVRQHLRSNMFQWPLTTHRTEGDV